MSLTEGLMCPEWDRMGVGMGTIGVGSGMGMGLKDQTVGMVVVVCIPYINEIAMEESEQRM